MASAQAGCELCTAILMQASVSNNDDLSHNDRPIFYRVLIAMYYNRVFHIQFSQGEVRHPLTLSQAFADGTSSSMPKVLVLSSSFYTVNLSCLFCMACLENACHRCISNMCKTVHHFQKHRPLRLKK